MRWRARLRRWHRREGLAALLRGSEPAPKGLYIFGPVGRGKTMLMDLFFEATTFRPKRRVHFHEFMAEVHDHIGAARKSVPGDPIPHVARALAAKARLICFDELHVTDIADAMILGRLFKGLLEAQVVVVATSNVPPGELYKNGLNRALFLPFIDLIAQHMDVEELLAAKDFRLEKLVGRPLYFTPADARAKAEMDRLWTRADRQPPGRADGPRRQGPQGPRAARIHGRGALLVRGAVRAAAGRERLPAHRPRLPHRADRRHSVVRATCSAT